jgi:Ala-tRNA(Pro) deacylase
MKTNAMRILESRGVDYEVRMHSQAVFTVRDAACERGVRTSQIVKVMVVRKGDGSFALALVPGHRKLSLKRTERAVDDPRVQLATPNEVSKVTGYRVGAVSPLGIRRAGVAVYLDSEVLEEEFVSISAGDPKVGLLLRSSDLAGLLDAIPAILTER